MLIRFTTAWGSCQKCSLSILDSPFQWPWKLPFWKGAFNSVPGWFPHILQCLKGYSFSICLYHATKSISETPCHFRALCVFLNNNSQGIIPPLALKFSFETLLYLGTGLSPFSCRQDTTLKFWYFSKCFFKSVSTLRLVTCHPCDKIYFSTKEGQDLWRPINVHL